MTPWTGHAIGCAFHWLVQALWARIASGGIGIFCVHPGGTDMALKISRAKIPWSATLKHTFVAQKHSKHGNDVAFKAGKTICFWTMKSLPIGTVVACFCAQQAVGAAGLKLSFAALLAT
jgi:hypothetical protein